ncbi:MAG: hypothetical protein QOD82_45 [Pseudonocardiales bacterium]|jgi:hypothetical protein|nr:hypothetical protein [Pseudonocardiales bacterium]
MSTPTRHPMPPAADPSPGPGGNPRVPAQRAHPVGHPAGGHQDPVRVACPAPVVRLCPAGSVELDQRMLVIGYLSTVASMLDKRGFLVRALHAQEPSSPTLWGEVILGPTHNSGSGWSPARLRWEQNSGWSAILLPANGDEHRAASRYLPAQLVPAPVTVAHFVAALHTDPDTVWARASLRPPRRVDRRWLILQLARFAMPEPW